MGKTNEKDSSDNVRSSDGYEKKSSWSNRYVIIRLLCRTVLQDPTVNITPTLFENRTGILRHIWTSRGYPRLQETMKELAWTGRDIHILPYAISNPADEIEKSLESPKKLIVIGEKLNILLNNIYEMVEHYRSLYVIALQEKEELIAAAAESVSEEDLEGIISQFNSSMMDEEEESIILGTGELRHLRICSGKRK